jgi:hypothetical protein
MKRAEEAMINRQLAVEMFAHELGKRISGSEKRIIFLNCKSLEMF